jgi:hypothetical protein
MQRAAADGVVCRCHRRKSPDGDFELHGQGIEWFVLRPGRAVRRALLQRALDIRDPYHPTEVGYFIPSITAATDKRCVRIDGKDRCKVAIQTNNVETDERGYIYIVDRANTGIHILELTGPARAVPGLP